MKDLPGTHVGFIIDGDAETPYIAVQLTVTPDECLLEIPMREGVTDAYQAWFSSFWSSNSDDAKIPESLVFTKLGLTCDLSALRQKHISNSMDDSQGTGILSVGRVVETGIDAPESYKTINALRSELDGLPAWIRPGVFAMEVHPNEEGRVEGVTYTVESKPSISVPGYSELALHPHFNTTHEWSNGLHSMRETMQIGTQFVDPQDWTVHHKLHRAIQDLVSIAYWFPCNAVAVQALREDDAEKDMGGGSHGRAWRSVVVPDFGRRTVRTPIRVLPSNDRPLFDFTDIGADGLGKWLAEYDQLGQAMWVLASSLFRAGGTVEVQLLQVGTALEALGYEIAIRSGRLTMGVKDKTFQFQSALRMIADDTDCDLSKIIDGHADFAAWSTAFNDAYKGVKHADNELPEPNNSYKRALQGAWLARVWLARHLGMDKEKLEGRIVMGLQ